MNVTSIRQKVAQAISKAPLSITVYRENKQPDGCGGYIISQENPVIRVGKVEGILDNSSSGSINTSANEGGKVPYSKAPQFITIWKPNLKFLRGDYFDLDGTRYVIDNPVNVLNMNIYWQLSLSAYIQEGNYYVD